MTLTVRPKPPAHHKKLSGKHHRRNKSYHQPYWPYLPILLIVFGGLVMNSVWPAKHAVLAYATDMSIQSLLDGTNSQRSGNGLSSLSLNTLLDQAAQAKANDMVTRDYWSHNTPDGQTPWSFMTAAGYNFQTAGENLAYGFGTADDTITGWMNSPGHRANILNSTYKQVGFGVANSNDFQNSGQETVVVAMYAEPIDSSAPVSSTVTAVPAGGGTTSVASSNQSTATTTTTPAASQSAAASEPSTTRNTEQTVQVNTPLKPIVESNSQRVTKVQLLTAGKAPWSITVLTILIAGGLLVFFTRHGLAWHKALRRGERFLIRHPGLDIGITLLIVIGLLLSRSVGSIR